MSESVAAAATPIPPLSRPVAVIGAVVAGVVINVVLWLIGVALGGSFELTENGETFGVAPGGVLFLSTAPMAIGMTLAALISYKWIGVLRVAAVIGSLLTLGTLARTWASDFDTPSMIALTLMHVVLVPVLVFATEGLRRELIARGEQQ